MKKKGYICYLALVFIICILPFAGMLFYKTDTSTENKKLAEFPSFIDSGTFNKNYIKELEAYFEDHFAFRNELVNLDSEIQSKAFRVSNMDTVVVGKNGWLYYSDTVNDYLGQNVLSSRCIYNIAHNVEMLQNYVQEQGATFLFTVAPNKNSLYGEQMPYYLQKKVNDDSNIAKLKIVMQEQKVNYADLFSVFRNQKEILYLKRDSHWNNKGAALAYNTLFDALELEHNTYETTKVNRKKEEYGDLNKILYPISAKAEWNYYYEDMDGFSYETKDANVESPWIITSSKGTTESLLMFRDSFGNTLLPFMANAFSKAYFSKSIPYDIENYMETYKPQVVIVEKVERNLDELAKNPPIMCGKKTELKEVKQSQKTNTTFTFTKAESNENYWCICGVLDEQFVDLNSNIYIQLKTENETTTYEAFPTTTNESDYGYTLYLNKELLKEKSYQIDVVINKEDTYQTVYSKNVEVK